MKKPILVERFADNGAFSHYALISQERGELLWSGAPEEEIQATKANLQQFRKILEKNFEKVRAEIKEIFEDAAKTESTKNENIMDKQILKKAIAKWGEQTQIQKIQEEALELALVLNQRNCPTKNPDEMEQRLYDELADMKIMMAQADILFDVARINERVKYKLEKLNKKYLN